MRERFIGLLAGTLIVFITYNLTRLPYGWVGSGLLLALTGWVAGGGIRRLRLAAERDQLTGMGNRRLLSRVLDREWERAIRHQRPLSLLFIDVDDFGLVNKRYGHLTGDQVLCLVCQLIRQNIRTTDLAVRWGGEEFVILLPETDLREAFRMAERLRCAVEQTPVRDGEHVIPVTLSAGVACWPGGAQSPAELLSQAIQGLATAKVRKNAVAFVS